MQALIGSDHNVNIKIIVYTSKISVKMQKTFVKV